MNPRLVMLAAASAMMLSATAFAASPSTGTVQKSASTQVAVMTSAEQCTALENQWNKNAASKKTNAMYNAAEKLATQGRKDCSSGKAADGVTKLQQAIKDIGLKPQA